MPVLCCKEEMGIVVGRVRIGKGIVTERVTLIFDTTLPTKYWLINLTGFCDVCVLK
jgi:hypothetical protein